MIREVVVMVRSASGGEDEEAGSGDASFSSLCSALCSALELPARGRGLSPNVAQPPGPARPFARWLSAFHELGPHGEGRDGGALRRLYRDLFVDAARAERGLETLARAYRELLAVDGAGVGGRSAPTAARVMTARRSMGAFDTPDGMVDAVLRQTLSPVLAAWEGAANTGALSICDPSCGTGAFLGVAARALLNRRREQLGARRAALRGGPSAVERRLIEGAIHGVDVDPAALELCRWRLWLELGGALPPPADFRPSLEPGCALSGPAFSDPDDDVEPATNALDWAAAFPKVSARGGFDLIIGNPPWVSLSGRRAVALGVGYREALSRRFSDFGAWPSLHGLFVVRSLALLRPRGRLALLLPEGVAELQGYGALRCAVRSFGRPLEPLTCFSEDAFPGVTHGSLALVVQGASSPDRGDDPFRVSSCADDLVASLQRLKQSPRPPAESFGDPGVHSGNQARRLVLREPRAGAPPVLEGRDVRRWCLGRPRRWLDLELEPASGGYFRISAWTRYERAVIVLRQTAHRPIAARHRPTGYFRNSVLACYGLAGVPLSLTLAWLNSAPIGWYHSTVVKEARQKSFPQVKVRALRDLPLPDWSISRSLDLNPESREEPSGTPGEEALDPTLIDYVEGRVRALEASEADGFSEGARALEDELDALFFALLSFTPREARSIMLELDPGSPACAEAVVAAMLRIGAG